MFVFIFHPNNNFIKEKNYQIIQEEEVADTKKIIIELQYVLAL